MSGANGANRNKLITGRDTYQKRDHNSPDRYAQTGGFQPKKDDVVSKHEGSPVLCLPPRSPNSNRKQFDNDDEDQSSKIDAPEFHEVRHQSSYTKSDSYTPETYAQEKLSSLREGGTNSSLTGKPPGNIKKSQNTGGQNVRSPNRNVTKINTPEKSPVRTRHMPGSSAPESHIQPEKSSDLTARYNQQNDSSNYRMYWAIVIVFSAFFIFNYARSEQEEVPLLRKNCSFDGIERQYPKQNNLLWKSLRVQIEGILNRNPVVPSVFLFLHTNKGAEDLIWKIAKKASTCFDPSLEPIKLDSDDFTSPESINDYGVIVKKYKEQIADGGALVVANLNEIPGKAARALHAICDTYSPIIDRVVIFLTLNVANEVTGNPIEVAENTLNEIWGSSLSHHELDPLIARVTEQVFYLVNEI